MKSAYRLFAALICFAAMGCSNSVDIKEKLGLNRQGPDEYRVVPRPPLSLPPDFNLRPPGKESEYVSGMPADQRAHDQVLGTDANATAPAAGFSADTQGSTVKNLAGTAVTPVTSGELPGSGDAQFLSDAGTSKIDPQIRQKLLDEKNVTSSDPNYLIGGKAKGDSVVDATKEADRLKQDKSQNLPPTAGGDTPVITPKDNGILGNIF